MTHLTHLTWKIHCLVSILRILAILAHPYDIGIFQHLFHPPPPPPIFLYIKVEMTSKEIATNTLDSETAPCHPPSLLRPFLSRLSRGRTRLAFPSDAMSPHLLNAVQIYRDGACQNMFARAASVTRSYTLTLALSVRGLTSQK